MQKFSGVGGVGRSRGFRLGEKFARDPRGRCESMADRHADTASAAGVPIPGTFFLSFLNYTTEEMFNLQITVSSQTQPVPEQRCSLCR